MSHLHRWDPATDDIPDDASRHGGAARAGHRVAPRRARHHPRPRARARRPVRRLRARRRPRSGSRRRRLVRHRRPRPRRGRPTAGTWCSSNAPPSRSGSRASSCPSRSSRTTWPPSPASPTTRCGSASGALVDDEVVLYAVADPLPLEPLRASIAELPAFMRPAAVARVGDAAARRRGRQGAATAARRRTRSSNGSSSHDRHRDRALPDWAADMTDLHVHAAPSLLPRHGNDAETRAAEQHGRLRHRRAQVARGQHRRARGRARRRRVRRHRAQQPGRRREPRRGRGRGPARRAGSCGCRPCPRRTTSAARPRPSCRCTAASNCAPSRSSTTTAGCCRPGTTCSTSSPRTTCCWPAGTCRPHETVLLFTEARRRGVQRLMVNHPLMAFLHWNDEAAQRAAGARRPPRARASCPTCSATPTTPASTSPAPTRRRCSSSAATSATPTTPAPSTAVAPWLHDLETRVGADRAAAIMTTQTRSLLLP